MTSTSSRLLAAAASSLALSGALAASSAEARTLGPAEMERAARSAVAPLAVDGTHCYHGANRRQGFCFLAHPATEGQICRSLVEIRAPRGKRGQLRTRVHRQNVCLTFPAPRT